ncbi:MAG: hypothetical protein J2O48_12570, partial [Solirubrobacterales bacterium]|nr:hypothetical protein [Solirubrobacterales bacterium]
ALVCLALALAVVGGAVSGQQASARLARPTRVDVHGRAIWSETEAVGRWFASQPPGAVLANDADAQTINLYGNHSAFSGDEAGADDVLDSPKVAPWMQKSLDLYDIRYIVADRRERSKDIVQGTFFNMQPPIAPIDKLYSPKVLSKWKRYGARVYDSGDIVVYDLHQAP